MYVRHSRRALKCVAAFVLGLLPFTVLAQDPGTGKVTGKVFTHWNYDLTDDDAITKKSEFDLTRAYFGYNYTINEKFSTSLTLDVERLNELLSVDTSTPPKVTKDTRYEAFLKTAYLEYKGCPKSTIQAGMIPLHQFGIQEKFWGYRYIFKSFQDENKFGSSADLGVSAKIKLLDQLQVIATAINGEGYKKPQDKDGIYKPSIGVQATPVAGLTAYVYGDRMSVNAGDSAATTSVATFVGYEQKDKFRAGAEYNIQMNQAGVETRDVTGVSVYGAYTILKNVDALARVDMLSSADDWNTTADGNTVIVGGQYSPVKNVKLSLNFQSFMPKLETAIDKRKLFVNGEFSF